MIQTNFEFDFFFIKTNIFDTKSKQDCSHRNARVFGNLARQCNEDVLAATIVEDMKLWYVAGLGGGDFGVDVPG
jgi:hypothetical protein